MNCPQCQAAGKPLPRALGLDWYECPNGHAAWARWKFTYTPKAK